MTVGDVPMSALVCAADDPRLVIVALHGGAVTSGYFDYPEHPSLSLLRAGASSGYTVIALDRPGYGASEGLLDSRRTTVDERVDLIFGAIDALLEGSPRGAGVFLLAHSMGCLLGVQVAASPRGASLLGLEIAGTGRVPHQDADSFMAPLLGLGRSRPASMGTPPRGALQATMWEPSGLYPPGAIGQLAVTRSAPRYEGRDIRGWVESLPSLAASVRIPVRYTLGDHERVWDPSPAAMSSFASSFTAAPRVSAFVQPDAAHNLSRCRTAGAYHQSVFAFAAQCVSGKHQPPPPGV